ncbi:unnamed protein product [Amoebophrya sp. A25]|nr:unnamed protein product [Amoebophrya sp. A25]|eukprot:GSA25T00006972001.1
MLFQNTEHSNYVKTGLVRIPLITRTRIRILTIITSLHLNHRRRGGVEGIVTVSSESFRSPHSHSTFGGSFLLQIPRLFEDKIMLDGNETTVAARPQRNDPQGQGGVDTSLLAQEEVGACRGRQTTSTPRAKLDLQEPGEFSAATCTAENPKHCPSWTEENKVARASI